MSESNAIATINSMEGFSVLHNSALLPLPRSLPGSICALTVSKCLPAEV